MNAETQIPSLVLTGGGTAGHVWPHFALLDDPTSPLATRVREGRLKVYYVGSHSGMERGLVSANAPDWTYVPIGTGKLRRYFSWQNFTDPFRILAGFLKTFFFLGSIQAAVVFSKGGFVSAPVVWAARLRGIPVVIHESDLSPALATRLTLPFATRALATFDETKSHCAVQYRHKVEVVGLPLRASLFMGSREKSLAHFGFDPQKKVLLIFGGSLGAEALNKRLAEAIPELAKRYSIIHLVGKGKSFPVSAGDSYRQYEFLTDEMKHAYQATDLAICRAGASSIFELAAARIPMILVPLGLHQSRGDQIENAKSFTTKGWADILWESDLTAETAIALVDHAMATLDERRKALATAPAADAARKVGDILLQTAGMT